MPSQKDILHGDEDDTDTDFRVDGRAMHVLGSEDVTLICFLFFIIVVALTSLMSDSAPSEFSEKSGIRLLAERDGR